MIKTGRSGRRWRTAAAFPGIKTDVMMIASSRNERGFLTKTGDEFEPEYPTVNPSARSIFATFKCTWPMRVPWLIGLPPFWRFLEESGFISILRGLRAWFCRSAFYDRLVNGFVRTDSP